MNKKILIVLLVASLTMFAFSISYEAYAWFYFPSIQDVIINTDTVIDVSVNLYSLDTVVEGDEVIGQRFNLGTMIDTDSDDIEDTMNISKNMSFYKWGSYYYSETSVSEIFAVEIIYEGDTFRNGRIKFHMDVEQLGETYKTSFGSEKDFQNYNIPFTNISYKFAESAKIDLASSEAISQATQIYELCDDGRGADDNGNAISGVTYYILSGTSEYKPAAVQPAVGSLVKGNYYYNTYEQLNLENVEAEFELCSANNGADEFGKADEKYRYYKLEDGEYKLASPQPTNGVANVAGEYYYEVYNNLISSNSLELVLNQELRNSQYNYDYSDNGNTKYRLRLVVFFLVRDSVDALNSVLGSEGTLSTDLAGKTIEAKNDYRFNFYLRTVPYKTSPTDHSTE